MSAHKIVSLDAYRAEARLSRMHQRAVRTGNSAKNLRKLLESDSDEEVVISSPNCLVKKHLAISE